MHPATSLIATLVAALGLAFLFGVAAHRFRLSPLVGYLAAGVLIGPFTPGFVADQALASQLAEIGVILLMFGVGLHFSLEDLLKVRSIAIPGATAQIAIVGPIGIGLAYLMGWSLGAGVVLGLALSVASTVVVLRALQERRLVSTKRGQIAVGWLIVQDIAMVLALVLIPAFASLLGGREVSPTDDSIISSWLAPRTLWGVLLVTGTKLIAFVTVMLVIGRRLIPWILHYVAHTGSRELFRLAVLVIALGVAFGSAELFGVSFALGAFFAGMILAESQLSQQAAQETLPLRDAFAVLFFVSVGMLFNPAILATHLIPVLSIFVIIVFGNGLAVFGIARVLKCDLRTSLTLAASLSQIGEFSFILSSLGVQMKILPEAGQDLLLAGALISILVNPLLFMAIERLTPMLKDRESRDAFPLAPGHFAEAELTTTALASHAVIVGHGRVGSLIASKLAEHDVPLLIIEERKEIADQAKARGIEVITGNAADSGILKAANLKDARWFVSAIPNPFENGNLIESARAANPNLEIIARAHSDAEVEHLAKFGASLIIMGEREIAHGITEHIIAQIARKDPSEKNSGGS